MKTANFKALFLIQVMLAEKNLYFLIKKTPEQDLKKFGIPNTPSLRRQMSIKASSPEQKTLCYVKALFDYDPYEDALHPCPDAGLAFQYGDILAVVNQDGEGFESVLFQENLLSKILLLRIRHKVVHSVRRRILIRADPDWKVLK